MSRERHQLDQTLNAIWRRGDQDEMSIKHIGHGLAALVAYGDWRKGEDYQWPIYYGDEGWTPLQVGNAYTNLEKIISVKWARVAKYLEDWGKDKFMEVLQESNFGFYPLSYLEDGHLLYGRAMEGETVRFCKDCEMPKVVTKTDIYCEHCPATFVLEEVA